MRAPLALLPATLLVAGLAAGCNNSSTAYPPPIPSGPISPTSPSTPLAPVTIEFRVLGDIGTSTAAVRFSDSINGATILASAGLPYVARITTTEETLFLSIAAAATPTVSIPYGVSPSLAVLQVQIVAAGVVFREDFATGFSALSVSASGTWHR